MKCRAGDFILAGAAIRNAARTSRIHACMDTHARTPTASGNVVSTVIGGISRAPIGTMDRTSNGEGF